MVRRLLVLGTTLLFFAALLLPIVLPSNGSDVADILQVYSDYLPGKVIPQGEHCHWYHDGFNAESFYCPVQRVSHPQVESAAITGSGGEIESLAIRPARLTVGDVAVVLGPFYRNRRYRFLVAGIRWTAYIRKAPGGRPGAFSQIDLLLLF